MADLLSVENSIKINISNLSSVTEVEMSISLKTKHSSEPGNLLLDTSGLNWKAMTGSEDIRVINAAMTWRTTMAGLMTMANQIKCGWKNVLNGTIRGKADKFYNKL